MSCVIFCLNMIAWFLFAYDLQNEITVLLGLGMMCVAAMANMIYCVNLEDRIAKIEKKLE